MRVLVPWNHNNTGEKSNDDNESTSSIESSSSFSSSSDLLLELESGAEEPQPHEEKDKEDDLEEAATAPKTLSRIATDTSSTRPEQQQELVLESKRDVQSTTPRLFDSATKAKLGESKPLIFTKKQLPLRTLSSLQQQQEEEADQQEAYEDDLEVSRKLPAVTSSTRLASTTNSSTTTASIARKSPASVPEQLKRPRPRRDCKLPPSHHSMTAGGRDWNQEENDNDGDEYAGNRKRRATNATSSQVRVVLENEPPCRRNGVEASASNQHHHSSDHAEERDNGTVIEEDDNDPDDDNNAGLDHEIRFARLLKQERGLEVVPQEGDGNCLFRAVALQVYGDAGMHAQVRQQCLNFMARDPQHFGDFISGEPFDAYIARKRQDGVHGNHAEIQACSELFNRPVQVFEVEERPNCLQPMNIFHGDYKTADAPIRLTYYRNHYNAIIDPLVPTAGLGLGLPGLRPGLADQMQVSKAVAESDADADLNYALKESQDDELERVLRESEQDAIQRALKESAFSMQAVRCYLL